MDKKIYEVGGERYFCDELELGQDELAVGLLAEMGFEKVIKFYGYVSVVFGDSGAEQSEALAGIAQETMGIEDILRAVSEKRLLSQLIATVLIPVEGEFDEKKIPQIQKAVKRLKRSQYLEVMDDFLSKNADSLKKLFGYSANGKANSQRPKAKSKKPSQRRRVSSLN